MANLAAGQVNGARRNRNRMVLVAIAVAFVLPILAAHLYYRAVSEQGPSSTTNHGVLVRPARPLGEFVLQRPSGGALDGRVLFGRWTVLHLERADCQEGCRRRLYNSRQVRAALHKDAPRVQRLLVTVGGYSEAEVAWLGEEHPDLELAVGAGEELRRLLGVLQVEPSREDVIAAQRTYLVDPHGNVMMWYPAGDEPHGLLKDLRKLLKVSQIG